MNETLDVDTDRLHALAPQFDALADKAMRAIIDLKSVMARTGPCWGDDELGRSFAETYVPDSEQGLLGLDNTVANLRGTSNDLGRAAADFRERDTESAHAIMRSGVDPVPTRSLHPHGNIGRVPVGARQPVVFPTLTRDSPTRTEPHAPKIGGPPGTPATAPPDTAAPGGPPGTTADRAPERPVADRGDNARTPEPPASATPAERVASQVPTDGVRAAAGTRAVAGDGRPDTTRATRGARVGSAAGRAPTFAASPTPWAKAAVSAGPPSGVVPPSTDPAPDASKTPWRPRQQGAPAKQATAPALGKPSAAQRDSRRPRIDIVGSDGTDAHTLREIMTAVEDTMTKYPEIDIRMLGIAELTDTELTRMEWAWSRSPSGPRPFTASIAFNAHAAADPDRWADMVATAIRSGRLTPGCGERPIYSTVVRELGHALDVAGGFRARATAQRALLAAYLRHPRRSPTDTMGRLVAGYRDWRSQLAGCCFHEGRLDPGMALAEAFTDVELRGDAASEPAVVLHQLLVSSARMPSPELPEHR